MEKLIYADESYKIIGACFNVYRIMGCGFLEPVYQECLEIELDLLKIPFIPQKEIKLFYKTHELRQTYRPDFLCYGKIIVEIKAISKIVDEHRAQLINYLNASHFMLGFLINFGHHPKLEFERFVLTK